jgi:hypothetical protein
LIISGFGCPLGSTQLLAELLGPCVPGPPKHGWKLTDWREIAPVSGLTEKRSAPASNE